jgi:hypothetical protein
MTQTVPTPVIRHPLPKVVKIARDGDTYWVASLHACGQVFVGTIVGSPTDGPLPLGSGISLKHDEIVDVRGTLDIDA